MYLGCCTVDATVPAVVAAALGKYSAKEAGKCAEEGGRLTCSIPGARSTIKEMAALAQRIMKDLAD